MWYNIANKEIEAYMDKSKKMLINAGISENQITVKKIEGSRSAASDILKEAREGEYTAVLHSNMGEPKEQTVRFTVYNDSQELRYVSADREVMEQLSDITRGECLGLDDLDTLPAKVKEFEMLTRERVKPEDIWDRLSIFAALIGLVGVEWLIRRISGLV